MSEEKQEILTAPVRDDFEVGDRIYISVAGTVSKGEVVSISGEDERSISVTMDDGEFMSLPLSAFADHNEPNHCGRIPNLDLITKGVILSRLLENGDRIYAAVSVHEPGQRLVLHRRDKFLPYDYETMHGVVLENVLFDWEIEG